MEKNVLNTDLNGKVAVVTGAGGVLCSAFAKVLARAGAKVALLDLNEEAAPEVTSNCYLTNILFEVGGIPKSTWLNMVDEYQMEYPVISTVVTMKDNGEFAGTDAILSEKKDFPEDLLNLYQKYSYGILYGIPKS